MLVHITIMLKDFGTIRRREIKGILGVLPEHGRHSRALVITMFSLHIPIAYLP